MLQKSYSSLQALFFIQNELVLKFEKEILIIVSTGKKFINAFRLWPFMGADVPPEFSGNLEKN